MRNAVDADKISLGSYYVWPLETVLNRNGKNIRSTIEGEVDLPCVEIFSTILIEVFNALIPRS